MDARAGGRTRLDFLAAPSADRVRKKEYKLNYATATVPISSAGSECGPKGSTAMSFSMLRVTVAKHEIG